MVMPTTFILLCCCDMNRSIRLLSCLLLFQKIYPYLTIYVELGVCRWISKACHCPPGRTIGRTSKTMSGKSEDVKVDVSKEEVAAAKAEIDAEEAEFDDAESPHTGDFEVTKEEMSIIRAELACEFPDDYTYLR